MLCLYFLAFVGLAWLCVCSFHGFRSCHTVHVFHTFLFSGSWLYIWSIMVCVDPSLCSFARMRALCWEPVVLLCFLLLLHLYVLHYMWCARARHVLPTHLSSLVFLWGAPWVLKPCLLQHYWDNIFIPVLLIDAASVAVYTDPRLTSS